MLRSSTKAPADLTLATYFGEPAGQEIDGKSIEDLGYVITASADKKGFRQVITNREHVQDTLERRTDKHLRQLMEYHHAVAYGDGKRPYCPFLPALEKRNGYYVKEIPSPPTEIDFNSTIEELRGKFLELRKSYSGGLLLSKVVVGVLSHKEAASKAFAPTINATRDKYRQSFVDQGMMFAIMHPHHPLGTQSSSGFFSDNEPLYNAPTPIIMVRERHPGDSVFPKDKEEYKKHI